MHILVTVKVDKNLKKIGITRHVSHSVVCEILLKYKSRRLPAEIGFVRIK